jgi:tRNA threonylcarbamoyladenosine biosynthesis protein TsaB
MIVALNTSTPTCGLFVYDGTRWHDHSWDAGRTLATHIHQKLAEALEAHHETIHDIEGLIVFQGPGSFTGLRIGLTVANTLAASLPCPIVGQIDTSWRETGLQRLESGENDNIILPLYGSDPIITQPKK